MALGHLNLSKGPGVDAAPSVLKDKLVKDMKWKTGGGRHSFHGGVPNATTQQQNHENRQSLLNKKPVHTPSKFDKLDSNELQVSINRAIETLQLQLDAVTSQYNRAIKERDALRDGIFVWKDVCQIVLDMESNIQRIALENMRKRKKGKPILSSNKATISQDNSDVDSDDSGRSKYEEDKTRKNMAYRIRQALETTYGLLNERLELAIKNHWSLLVVAISHEIEANVRAIEMVQENNEGSGSSSGAPSIVQSSVRNSPKHAQSPSDSIILNSTNSNSNTEISNRAIVPPSSPVKTTSKLTAELIGNSQKGVEKIKSEEASEHDVHQQAFMAMSIRSPSPSPPSLTVELQLDDLKTE